MGDCTGKIDHLHLPVFNFRQVTRGTAADLQLDLGRTGEYVELWGGGGGLRKILYRGEQAGCLKYCINKIAMSNF